MTGSRRHVSIEGAVCVVAFCASLAWTVATGPATGAQVAPDPLSNPTPSDPTRATFVVGNLARCDQVGFGGSIQLGSESNTSESDANVSGTVVANTGPVQAGRGQALNVTLLNPNVVIGAIVVKGGPAANGSTNPAVLPPALPPPQNYISPFNAGGNIPNISHWFICYRIATPALPVGSLTVQKQVIAPDGIPVQPLPPSFTVVVNCDDENPAHDNVIVT